MSCRIETVSIPAVCVFTRRILLKNTVNSWYRNRVVGRIQMYLFCTETLRDRRTTSRLDSLTIIIIVAGLMYTCYLITVGGRSHAIRNNINNTVDVGRTCYYYYYVLPDCDRYGAQSKIDDDSLLRVPRTRPPRTTIRVEKKLTFWRFDKTVG